MNEQLIVKNFGPIKDATVDFKRVTVFIGPTGGGKSTLAKLAAIYRDSKAIYSASNQSINTEIALDSYSIFNLENYFSLKSYLRWEVGKFNKFTTEYINGQIIQQIRSTRESPLSSATLQRALSIQQAINVIDKTLSQLREIFNTLRNENDQTLSSLKKSVLSLETERNNAVFVLKNETGLSEEDLHFYARITSHVPYYIPSERQIISVLNQSWPSLLENNVVLPPVILDFVKKFLHASIEVKQLAIPFFEVEYKNDNGKNLIYLPSGDKTLLLSETASGIQSVTPLLVLLEHLSRNTEQAQSFIIEEPELNLYPTAQQGLLDWLVEKCTKEENDLTITTHSPYILSHLNLLLYAYQVAEKHPERAEEVAELVPRASWINPKEFACYQVENGGVTSLVDEELGLIDDNGLDNLSGDAADAFDNLIRLSKGVARK